MKSTANRIVLLVGAFVLALMAVDGLIQLNQSALAEFGYGESTWVQADSAMALFLVGLVAGMLLGIGIFFGFIVWREKQCTQETDDLDALLEEVSREADLANPLFVDESPSGEEIPEPTDPWERPADWWKNGEDE
ncbi:MAG: hypothetical protein P1U85_06560 [Verrucomicrobiales bacterium]|nr:hypothetical protein [Verrucomicrobiales bacterium]